MDIRSQIAMVFHLDKCIGCHTCSIACKNIWTDRKGAEYMWWNNVETKPGTGYPTRWEDQKIYKGGWVKNGDKLELRVAGKPTGLTKLYHNPDMPVMDDYYEPWTYDYDHLFEAPPGDDQPSARTISLVTGDPIDVKGGPNWDDDLSGTPDYGRNDINLNNLSAEEKESMFQLERMTMHYLPRMCNHCLNPSCVAACPSGAVYKRGEDGIVLINQDKCRAWRLCVTACPYKKSYYNWTTGKSEKCLLCYPRIESGQAPACMHSCVGRIRYLGVLLYDADKIEEFASSTDDQLIDRQLDIYLDPHNSRVIKLAKKNGIADSTIEAAQKSPVYRFVKEWKIALPLHAEFRTLPNLFYVPPLLPVIGKVTNGMYDSATESLWGKIDETRLPVQYLANLFSAGNQELIKTVLKKLMTVRYHRRSVTVNDIEKTFIDSAFRSTGLTPDIADSIYRLTSLVKYDERFVIPPEHREEAIEMIESTDDRKGNSGFGEKIKTKRVF
ncbi:MAG: nitrate reductase subunit beta [Bacteroidales bacterium]|nr:nitrate reductase subunit beta [Bacteroidales bacterium]